MQHGDKIIFVSRNDAGELVSRSPMGNSIRLIGINKEGYALASIRDPYPERGEWEGYVAEAQTHLFVRDREGSPWSIGFYAVLQGWPVKEAFVKYMEEMKEKETESRMAARILREEEERSKW